MNPNQGSNRGYPEGEALQTQIESRHRAGTMWRTLFLAVIVVGVVALTALLFNIMNQSFGLVAIENEIDPGSIVLSVEKRGMLNAENVIASEDDQALAQGIVGNPYAIGFFGYAYYQDNRDTLRVLSVDGVEPTAATVNSNEYPLSRPLFIYTTADIMQEKSQVSAFINYYLTHMNEEIEDVGYFPASSEALNGAKLAWREANGVSASDLSAVAPEQLSGAIKIAGSSTVFPVTQRIADRFESAGFSGDIELESIGSTAGLRLFCAEGTIDIANASRPITPAEREACLAHGRAPIAFPVVLTRSPSLSARKTTF